MSPHLSTSRRSFVTRNRTFSVLIIMTCIAVAFLAIYAADQVNDTANAPVVTPSVKVAVAKVQRTSVPSVITGIGELEAARQVRVGAEVGGRVTKISFESGQRVVAGQMLVQLNDAPEQAERIRRQAQLRNATSVHTRLRSLVTQHAATQEQLDAALAARDTAHGDLRHVEALIAQKAIRAPFSGEIGIRGVHEGQYLEVGAPVASLVDAGTLHINFSLNEQSSPRLQIGQSVEVVVDAYPGRRFQAAVTAIDPLIDRSRLIQVQATMANPDNLLKAGMYAKIQVARHDTPSVLTIPETAITYTAYGDTAFVVETDDQQMLVVRRVAVQVGERRDGRVEIEKGLRETDQVVTSGQLRLSDGMAVEAVKEDTLAASERGPLSADWADTTR